VTSLSCLEPPLWFVLVLAAILLPSLAWADDFRLLPSVMQTLQYNDNIFITPTAKVHDFISATTGGLEVYEAREQFSLHASGQLTENLYEKNTGADSTDSLGNGSIRYAVNPQLSLLGSGSYSHASQPDQQLLTTGLVLNGVTLDSSAAHVEADYVLTEKTTASLSWDYGMLHYQSSAFSDQTTNTGTLAFSHDLSQYVPQLKGLLNMSYSNYTLTGQDVNNYEATTGFSYPLQEKWAVQLTAGFRRTDSSFETFVPTGIFFVTPAGSFEQLVEQTESTSGWGGVGQAAITYQGEVTNASLSASRGLAPAAGQNGTVETTSFIFSADRRFTYDLHGTVSTGFFVNKSGAGQFATAPINFVTFNFAPALRYEFGHESPSGSQYARDMFVEASYTFTRIEDKEANTTGNRSLFMIRFFAQHALLE
jgi:hypothetical protein